MLDIFFTNKIPSTNDDWTDELIQVATIFSEFDGHPFDYGEITGRFEVISQRYSDVRDKSDYRDQYGAYGSYLGLIGFERIEAGDRPVCRLHPFAQKLLCNELPDPEAYVRAQLALFQYPNPIGTRWIENGNVIVEPHSLEKRIQMIRAGVRTVPFRLFLKIMTHIADHYPGESPSLSFGEIWDCLFTCDHAVCTLEPDTDLLVREILNHRRLGVVSNDIPSKALRNLHILKHTGLITFNASKGKLSRSLELIPEAQCQNTKAGYIARLISRMNVFFECPRSNASVVEIKDWSKSVITNGSWYRYYLGGGFSPESVSTIRQHVSYSTVAAPPVVQGDRNFGGELAELSGMWVERKDRFARRRRAPVDSEETYILRERANLRHRELMKLISDRIRINGEVPLFNRFIDIATTTKGNERLFEVKSCRPENILPQVRKGVSQLYEYRYRHNLLASAELILVLEQKPQNENSWLVRYLVEDRQINVCWQTSDETLEAPEACRNSLGRIVDNYE